MEMLLFSVILGIILREFIKMALKNQDISDIKMVLSMKVGFIMKSTTDKVF